MPLPGTRVIHPDWSAHHRPTATGAMTATCIIRRRGEGEGTTNPDGTVDPPAAVTIYTGPCRLQALTTNERIEVAGDTQDTVRRYLIPVEWDAALIEVGDEVEITEAKDPQAAGIKLRVVDIRYGSEQWQRDLVAEETWDEEAGG